MPSKILLLAGARDEIFVPLPDEPEPPEPEPKAEDVEEKPSTSQKKPAVLPSITHGKKLVEI